MNGIFSYVDLGDIFRHTLFGARIGRGLYSWDLIQMRKPNIQLCYLHEGKDFEFLLDVGNSNDRRRLLSTIEWAARNNVEIAILPIQNDEAKTDNIRAIA